MEPTIIRCRVITGRYEIGNDQMKEAPITANGELRLHSTVDDQLYPNVFVIYKDYRVYPEYLIKLKSIVIQRPKNANNLRPAAFVIESSESFAQTPSVDSLSFCIPFPMHWTCQELTSASILQLVDVPPGTREYRKVASSIRGRIEKITRVENARLWFGYQAQKELLKAEMKHGCKLERILYHGTSWENIEKICRHDFNRSYAGVNGKHLKFRRWGN